jgi:rare lipoprotein A
LLRIAVAAQFAAQFATWGLLGVVACAAEQEGGNRPRAAQTGIASVYGGDRHRGSRTANGERVHPGALTAAHRTYPFGTKVRVTNLRNGRSVVVRINDRGPFRRGRVIDVTPAAARVLGFSGLASVSLSTARELD